MAIVDPAQGERIGGWYLPATCPACGGGLLHVTNGPAIHPGDARAVAQCEACGRGWLAVARLVALDDRSDGARARQTTERSRVPDDPTKVHGTVSAWRRGCGCPQCYDAQQESERNRPKRDRSNRARDRRVVKA